MTKERRTVIAPQEQFTGRAVEYAQARPGYPDAVTDWLGGVCGLRPGATVADVGAGTGIFSELLLKAGARVVAVEPNADMRGAAERALAGNAAYSAIDGTAERTGIDDGFVDLVVAAQAFHWFDASAARAEFRRILKPEGWVVLVWNDRRTSGTPFLEAWEAMLRGHCPDYDAVVSRIPPEEVLREYLGVGSYRTMTAPNEQIFDRTGFLDRLKSCSYFPRPGAGDHSSAIEAAEAVFDAHSRAGQVRVAYDTRVHCGRLEGTFQA